MRPYILSPRADADLDALWSYVASARGPAVADRLEDRLHAAMHRLAAAPAIGHRRPDVQDQRYRFWSEASIIIAYFADTDPVQIVRVVDGRRDLRRLFR